MSLAYRLPNAVRPLAYAIEIETDPSWPTFSGSVEMQLDVTEPIAVVEMHARALVLSDATVNDAPVEIELNADSETVRFVPKRRLDVGPAKLRVTFAGHPNPGMHGLYLARDGSEEAVATQCEATDARAIFPCFDEPAFKASFQWTVRTSEHAIALANGPLKTMETDRDGRRVWRFAATPPVSSYLAALTVGPYEAEPAIASNGTPLRVWALRGKKDQTEFARVFTKRLFPWFEDYFGLPYAYDKYDQVAVPGFDAGAMENVGLVLFRQNLLLMDPRSASWNQEKLIAKVIAHELAHMWFGNLVTMSWWDDLWLNEAFAEWFAHKAAHAVAPQYQVWHDFQLDKNRALTDDAMDTTHAVWTPVETPSEALEMFDVITYQKGCAVMRMLECFVEEQPFRAGIRAYMKAFAGRNATGDDLWSHLESASGLPVGRMMRSWVEQPGFPLLTVAVEGSTVSLTQRRFFSQPARGASAGASSDQLWNVPVRLRFEDNDGPKVHAVVLTERVARIELPAHGPVQWVYGNADEVGFYRVHHAGESIDRLPLQHLSAPEQMGLLEDQWSLVRNGTIRMDRFVHMIDRFAESADHNVLRALSDRLSTLDRLLTDHGDMSVQDSFRSRVCRGFRPHLEQLGFDAQPAERQDRMQRRAVVLHVLGIIGEDQDVIQAARKRAEEERKDARAVDANLAGTYLSIAARFGDESLYEAWLDTYRRRRAAGAAPQDALRYLYTLTGFRKESLTDRTLSLIAEGTIPQEAMGGIVSQLLASHHGRLPAWRYLCGSWSELRPRIGDMGISRVVEAVGRLPGTERNEIVAFFERTPPVGAERALARALANMDQYEELRERTTPALLRAFGRGG